MNKNLSGLKVRIETAKFEECLRFYGDILGLAILEEWHHRDDRGVIFGFDSNLESKGFLELGYTEHKKEYSGLSLQIRVHSITLTVQQISGVVEFEGPTERPWGSKYLYLSDPAGVSVILYEGTI